MRKEKMAIVVAEFLGTFTLASAVLAVSQQIPVALFGAMAAGLVLAGMSLVIGPVSGSHINPAVTLGLWSLRKVPTVEALVYIVAQMVGGLVALYVGSELLGATLADTVTSNWNGQIMAAEIIGAFIFGIGVAAAVYRAATGGQLAATLGVSLFFGIMVASLGSSGMLNPAVALGTNTWSIAYVVAPLIGAVLGMQTYALLFAEPVKAARRNKR